MHRQRRRTRNSSAKAIAIRQELRMQIAFAMSGLTFLLTLALLKL